VPVGESLGPCKRRAAGGRILHIKSGEHADAVACSSVERAGALAADSVEVGKDAIAVGFGVVADGLDIEHVAVQEFRSSNFGVAADVVGVEARLELLGGGFDGLDGERGGVCCKGVWRCGEFVEPGLVVTEEDVLRAEFVEKINAGAEIVTDAGGSVA